MKRCASGHYFDPGKHVSCPLCGAGDFDFPKTAAPKFAAVAANPPPGGAQDGRTVAVVKKDTGADPVVGWLVCISGPNRGADYRLHTEKNFLGRASSMDVCIAGDETISRENHAAVSFNAKDKSFKLLPGESRGLVYANGEEVDAPLKLKSSDIIELGKTKLMLVPLCGPAFDWADFEK